MYQLTFREKLLKRKAKELVIEVACCLGIAGLLALILAGIWLGY